MNGQKKTIRTKRVAVVGVLFTNVIFLKCIIIYKRVGLDFGVNYDFLGFYATLNVWQIIMLNKRLLSNSLTIKPQMDQSNYFYFVDAVSCSVWTPGFVQMSLQQRITIN